MRRKFLCGAVAICLSVFVSAVSNAAIITFEANLDGLQVVAPNASPAFGVGEFTLNDSTGAVNVVTGSYQDLLGGASSVSLNGFANAGTNAANLFSLTLDSPGAATGTYSGGGLIPLLNVQDMIDGKTYVIIRSSVFPGGEIRGQLIAAVPEPGSLSLLALAGLTAVRRRRSRV